MRERPHGPTEPSNSPTHAGVAEFPSRFPWLEGLEARHLSTERGFVFQFPPFPVWKECGFELVHAPIPAALYVHIPFCPYHCAFCYYSVSMVQSDEYVERYLAALEKEMALQAALQAVRRHEIRTVFLGGGTPTLLSAQSLQCLIGSIRKNFALDAVQEFTVESDPTTLSAEKLATLRSAGVNRISIGVQTFSTRLNLLNARKHTEEQSLEAVRLAREAGIGNINLDLICGLIGETKESWKATIEQLIELSPEHATIYLLSMRPQTRSYTETASGRLPAPPGDELRIEMYLYARQRLLELGYLQTTPNCFVRDRQFEQLHQRHAWSSEPLLGFGNSAYAFLDGCVTQNLRSTSQYMHVVHQGKLPVEHGLRLSARDLMVRYCVLRLKQLWIPRQEFQVRFGFDVLEVFGEEMNRLTELSLIEISSASVSLTTRGIVYVDDVCRTLYTPEFRRQLASMDHPLTSLRKSLI